jgi:hypothetical protein
MISLLVFRKKYGNELVAALSDLASRLLEADLVAELGHRFMPGERVEIDRVQERSVEVEDSCLRHSRSSGARAPDFRLPLGVGVFRHVPIDRLVEIGLAMRQSPQQTRK